MESTMKLVGLVNGFVEFNPDVEGQKLLRIAPRKTIHVVRQLLAIDGKQNRTITILHDDRKLSIEVSSVEAMQLAGEIQKLMKWTIG